MGLDYDADRIVDQFPEELTSFNSYDSWLSYESTLRELTRPKGNRVDSQTSLMSPDVIKCRALAQRWLTQMEFDTRIQDAVMLHDCPHINKVIKMVTLFGKHETERRLLRFLFDGSNEV